ncbi:MAG: hypothetical protein VX309_09790 [Pseudomonadota bacterium]|nr:hypothetical protein [Pseudomonadota bacterium]MEE3155803.1 hypothetical protein [Pseudomonadota bacterium]
MTDDPLQCFEDGGYMIVDEPAAWAAIPDDLRPKVQIAAKAICRTTSALGEEGPDHCAGCDTPAGGSCCAFGLWGKVAFDVVKALEEGRAE